jgi:hypothetical protein
MESEWLPDLVYPLGPINFKERRFFNLLMNKQVNWR